MESMYFHCGDLTVSGVIVELNRRVNEWLDKKPSIKVISISHSVLLNKGLAYEGTAILIYKK